MRIIPSLSRLTGFLLALHLLMVCFPSPTHTSQETAYPVFDDFSLPESLSLCGEPVPLENRWVWEMLDREFTVAVWDRAQVFMWLKRAGRYFPYIEKKLSEAGFPEDLKYLAVAESSLITNIRSRKGAAGTWQFMPRTAQLNGLRKDHTMDERRDFELSTEAALKHLKRLKGIFGAWTLALAAYNCGESRLNKEIKKQKVRDYYRLNLPTETERFIFRIAAAKIIMGNPKRYGYTMAPERVYRPIKCDTVPVNIRTRIHITDMALSLGTDLKVLKDLNPQIISYYLPTGRYRLKVPSGQGARVAAVLKRLDHSSPRRSMQARDAYYIVQPGDTLSKISRKTRVPVGTLRKLNGIHGSVIKVGQKILLMP